ncbi:MAG TPA: triose-phosphate isomerase [Planctomycetota bacterium]|nr:triose-phosphate isomerase [Planctomycetota bacterium]
MASTFESPQASSHSGRPPARGLLIAGNWKMYKGLDEAVQLTREIAAGLPPGDQPGVAIFPPAIWLSQVANAAREARKAILVGAQNIHFEREGAFTGEISAEMVLSAGGRAVLVGHSERRHVFGERDGWIGKKVARALDAGLSPILCVGEKLEERESGRTNSVVSGQMEAGIAEVSDPALLARITIAYEPVWAIGTGKTATPAQGQEVHRFLREVLRTAFASRWAPAAGAPGAEATANPAEEVRILYGGSVKPENAAEILAKPDIDGLLVGGASLKADSFLAICRAGVDSGARPGSHPGSAEARPG